MTMRQNIGVPPGMHEYPPAACDATRTVPAGGALAGLLLHDSITPFQWILRILPTAAFFMASRENVLTVPIGSTTVPERQALAVGEYRFRVYRFDGLNPGDAVPLEDRRLSLEVGNYVSISSSVQKGNILTQIVPAVPPSNGQNYTGQFAGVVTGGTTSINRPPQGPPLRNAGPVGNVSNIYGSSGSNNVFSSIAPALIFPAVNTRQFVRPRGASLLPNSNDPQQGPERLPFTYYAMENQTVNMELSVFAAVKTPIAFIEATIAGYQIPLETLRAFLEKVRPCDGR